MTDAQVERLLIAMAGTQRRIAWGFCAIAIMGCFVIGSLLAMRSGGLDIQAAAIATRVDVAEMRADLAGTRKAVTDLAREARELKIAVMHADKLNNHNE